MVTKFESLFIMGY